MVGVLKGKIRLNQRLKHIETELYQPDVERHLEMSLKACLGFTCSLLGVLLENMNSTSGWTKAKIGQLTPAQLDPTGHAMNHMHLKL